MADIRWTSGSRQTCRIPRTASHWIGTATSNCDTRQTTRRAISGSSRHSNKCCSIRRACGEHGHSCHQGLFSRSLFVGQRIPLAGVAHQNGTIRFGRDPKTSALDPMCKAHDLDNLYVVDGSFFPSSGAVNPR